MPRAKSTTRLPDGWALYYRVVKRIPRGRVCTYGEVAAIAGRPRSARHVGFAMAALRGTTHRVPWHRVMGAKNRAYATISIKDAVGGGLQRELLEREGVVFDASGRVSRAAYGWPRAKPRSANGRETSAAKPRSPRRR